MIDKEHRWAEFVDNLYQEDSVLKTVTAIHRAYLGEKSVVAQSVKKDEITTQIIEAKKDLKFVSAVLSEIIKNRLNKGYTIVEPENLKSFEFYIKDLHIVIDNIESDINYQHNRIEAIQLIEKGKQEKKQYKTEIGIAITALIITVILSCITLIFEILTYYK